MSHWISIKTQVNDLASLEAASRELGCTLYRQQGDQSYIVYAGQSLWFGRNATALIAVPGMYYPVQIIPQKDGTFALSTESDYAAEYAKHLGPNLQRLIQMYGVHRATAAARKQGHAVKRSLGPNGRIILEITGSSL